MEREIIDLPRHRNPGPSRTASAPYNFVPLPDAVVTAVDSAGSLPHHDTYRNEGYPHTGYLQVTLTTRSPLYVRCPLEFPDFLRQERREDQKAPFREQAKNTPHFFYTRDPSRPVLPGSSLRGMLRGLMEIVSYGKRGGLSLPGTFPARGRSLSFCCLTAAPRSSLWRKR